MGATVSRDEVATIMEMVGVGAEVSGEGPRRAAAYAWA